MTFSGGKGSASMARAEIAGSAGLTGWGLIDN
jgi:hypothetical protein